MSKKNKILLRVAIIILIVTLITMLILSSVYAKYVTEKNSDVSSGRPAAFEVVMKTPLDDEIEVNFAADGEPGSPIGYTKATKDYEFSVVTNQSEVASDYSLELVFSPKVSDKIRQARADKYAKGLWCDFEVYQGQKNSDDSITYSSTPLRGIEVNFEQSGTSMTWMCTEVLAPSTNPGGTAFETCYKIKMIFYNNTMMEDGRYKEFLFNSDGLEIKVTSKQVNPNFKGDYVY